MTAKLNRLHLRATFAHRYSRARPGTAFAQDPSAGARLKTASAVSVTISKGPAPIKVPHLTGQSATSASSKLHHLGLDAGVTNVPAPGAVPGVVTRQSPAAGSQLKPRGMVELFVAEAPTWRDVTSFSADGGGHSVPFQIQGAQWRVVYSMSYDGTCDFVFFCNGPSAQVLGLGTDSTDESFDLNGGSSKTRVFKTGPGLYQINIKSGWDSAHWSVEVEDWF